MAIDKRKIIRLGFETTTEARAVDAMIPGQWAFCKTDKVLIVKDLAGDFTEYPSTITETGKARSSANAPFKIGYLDEILGILDGLEFEKIQTGGDAGKYNLDVASRFKKAFGNGSNGLLSGGELSPGVAIGAVQIAALTAISYDHTTTPPQIEIIEIAQADHTPTGLNTPGEEFSVFYVDTSDNTIKSRKGSLGLPDLDSSVIIGSVGHENGGATITSLTPFAAIAENFENQVRRYILANGVVRIGTPPAVKSGTKKVSLADGFLVAPGINNGGLGTGLNSNRIYSGGDPLSFKNISVSGFNGSATDIDGGLYEPNNGGGLDPVVNNKFTIRHLLIAPSGVSFYLTYGTKVYDSLEDAQAGLFSDLVSLPSGLLAAPLNRAAAFIVKKAMTDTASETDFKIIPTSKTGDLSGGGGSASTPTPGGGETETYSLGRFIKTSPGNAYYVGLAESSDGQGSIYGPVGTFGSFTKIDLRVCYAAYNQSSATIALEYTTNGSTWTQVGNSFSVTSYTTIPTARAGTFRTFTGVTTAQSKVWRIKVSVGNSSTNDTISGQLRFYN